jgi:dihydroorotase
VDQGVGVVVDAGSAPPSELFRRLDAAQAGCSTTVLAWANICAEGIAGRGCESHDISGGAARTALRELPGRVVGIKLQASSTRLAARGLEAIENAKRVAAEFGVPLLVHVGNGPPTMREVAAALRPGDIITHFAHGKPEGALAGSAVHPALLEARARGVLFDVGHGAGSFSFEVMEGLMARGFAPDIISTDLHRASAESPVGSLADCMSKLLCLGMSEEAVIRAVTTTPQAALHLPPSRRRTRFVVYQGDWAAVDSHGSQRTFRRRFHSLGIGAEEA